MLLICVSIPPLYPLMSFIFPALLGRGSISRRKKSSQGDHISSDPPSSVKAKLDEDSDDFYQMKIMQGGPNTERTKVTILVKRDAILMLRVRKKLSIGKVIQKVTGLLFKEL
jgi:hypothetical protein